MYRAFVIVFSIMASAGGIGSLGYYLGSRTRPQRGPNVKTLKVVADLNQKALDEEMMGHPAIGMAYRDAARELLELEEKN